METEYTSSQYIQDVSSTSLLSSPDDETLGRFAVFAEQLFIFEFLFCACVAV